jgi:hypothetical protein
MKMLFGHKFKIAVLATMLKAKSYPFMRFIGLAIGQSFWGVCWRVRLEADMIHQWYVLEEPHTLGDWAECGDLRAVITRSSVGVYWIAWLYTRRSKEEMEHGHVASLMEWKLKAVRTFGTYEEAKLYAQRFLDGERV